jgi:ABC-type transport system involved in multi-copper enzyme maturation permease subunit
MLILYLATVSFFGIFPLFSAHEPGMQSWLGLYNTSYNFLSLVLLSVIGAQVFGHEYRYGTIRLTLTEFPKREIVMVAKSSILLFFVVFAVVFSWGLLGFLAQFAPDGTITKDSVGFTLSPNSPAELWKVLFYVVAYLFISMSIVAITRNLAMGIVLPLLMSTVIEGLLEILNQFAKQRFDWLINRLPFNNANDWLSSGGEYVSPGLTFAAWVVGLYLLATYMFFKRDA